MSTVTQPATTTTTRPRRTRLLARLAALIAALLLVAYIGVATLAAVVLTTPRRTLEANANPQSLGLAYRDVQFQARGGDVQLRGWFVPAQSKRAVLLVHGKDGSRSQWTTDEWRGFVPALHNAGFAVLLVDLRGHGASDAARYSFGLNEQRDVLGALDWLREQGFPPNSIGVLGVSLGAASSMMAVAQEPAVGALVEDCGYAAIKPIIEAEWTNASGLPQSVLPGALLVVQLLTGYDIAAARPVDDIAHIAPRPLLIIHGTADQLIPVADADQLRAAYPAAEIWRVAGATHANAFATQPQEYTRRVVAFFEQHLR